MKRAADETLFPAKKTKKIRKLTDLEMSQVKGGITLKGAEKSMSALLPAALRVCICERQGNALAATRTRR